MAARRIFITGVGRGLGRELARRLDDDGHEVWGSTRDGTTDLDIVGDGIQSPDLVVNCAGADARAMTVDESSAPIVHTLGTLTLADTGRFVRWDGRDHPW